MKYTGNYNLKKPEGTDLVKIEDFNDNADILDVELGKKADKTQVLTDVPAGAKFTDTVYTHPTTAGNKHIPTGGAVGQILKNTASGTATWQAETITSIANNLTETVAGKALDATQGKVLDGKIAATTSQLNEIATGMSTTEDITYYVSTAGNDVSGDGSNIKPFKTIQKAIDKMPFKIDHDVTIVVANGTYSERPLLGSKIGKGKITIQGASSRATTHTINGFSIKGTSVLVILKGFNSVNTQYHNYVVENSIAVIIDNCISNGNTTIYSAFLFGNALGSVSNCEASGKYAGIMALQNSKIFSSGNVGIGNTIGLNAATNGVIGKTGTQPAGINANEYMESGGVIR